MPYFDLLFLKQVVEIFLKYLDQPQKAFDLVRKNPTQQKSMMETFVQFIGEENMSNEIAIKVAQYYEKLTEYGKAGKCYSIAGNYPRALKLFLQCGDREINEAIKVVGKAQNETLTHELIDFLVGEKDGIPKDSAYIYSLYLRLKKYEDAAKTALILIFEEQKLGNYLGAYKIVVEIIRQLEDTNMKVNLQLRQSFVLLHSYLLAKSYVTSEDHLLAAKLLMRCVDNLSKFPKHNVGILSSAVVECKRAGLKKEALKYAKEVIKPEYRAQIHKSVKSSIETLARKKLSLEEAIEPSEETSPCPISGLMIPVMTLECPTTRDALPMCIITGKHMVLDDWCICPISKFPALYSEYIRYIRETSKRLLASASIDSQQDEQLVKMKSIIDKTHHRDSVQIGMMNNPNEPQTDDLEDNNSSKSQLLISANDMSLSAPDPIMGKLVSVNDLILCTKDEALKYIKRYNNIREEKLENNNSPDAHDGNTNEFKENKENSSLKIINEEENVSFDSSSDPNENLKGTKESKIGRSKLDRIQRSRMKKNSNK